MEQSPTTKPPGYIEVLRKYPQYRKVYLARLVSMMGDWMSLIALLTLMREASAGNAHLMGALVIAKMLPPGLLGPFAGVIADRFSRKKIMIASDVVRFFVVLGYFTVTLLPPDAAVYIVLTLAFLQSCAGAFFDPCRNAMMPSLVPTEALATANALGAVTWSLTYTLGSLVGGVLTAWLGWQGVLILDALTFLLSAAFLISLIDPTPKREKRKLNFWHYTGIADLLEGFKFIKGHPRITYVMFIKFGLMFGGSLLLVLTLYGQEIYGYAFGSEATAVGVFMAVRAMGTAAGPIAVRRWAGNSLARSRIACVCGLFVAGILYIAFGLAENLWLVLFLVFMAHIGSSVVWVYSTIMLQRLIPDAYAGRVFAAELALATLMISLSNDLTGRAIEMNLVSIKDMPMVLGAGVFCAGLVFFAWGRRPKLRGTFE